MSWQKRAKSKMKELGFNQTDLIQVLGVKTRGAVGHYLADRRKLKPEQCVALADKLQCSMEWLFNNSNQNNYLVKDLKIDSLQEPLNSYSDENSIALMAINNLKGKVTETSNKTLIKLKSLAENGKLSDQDWKLLERIANRFEEDKPEYRKNL